MHVTLEEAKAHLRVTHSAEDSLIESTYVPAAIAWLSNYTGRFIASAEITEHVPFSNLSGFRLPVPAAPVRSVTEVALVDEDGEETVIAPEDYELDTFSNGEGEIEFSREVDLSCISFRIDYEAGYAEAIEEPEPVPSELPADLRAAILFMVAHLYENRMPVVIGTITADLPLSCKALADPYRLRIFIGA
jgi:uncharacterized phiE125 gp8 family phage protein